MNNILNGTIKKIKASKDGVEIHWEDVKSKSEQETQYWSKEQEHPDFRHALDAVGAEIKGLLGFISNRYDSFELRGLSFSWTEETKIEGVVATCQVKLGEFANPMIINTPHATFQELPPSLVAKIENARREARQYVEGKRAQLELAGTK